MYSKVENWLKEMGLDFSYDETNKTFALPYIIDDLKYEIIIHISDTLWILVNALILEKQNVPDGIYEALLNANYELKDISYSVNEGNIFVECVILQISNFESFKLGFDGVIEGIRYYLEKIAPKFNIPKKSPVSS